uniref:Uncharacterized protein n=1 Tax=Cacopsylla melanoneura TaxID=428564 RepID=A0A8D8VI22_9HEMI
MLLPSFYGVVNNLFSVLTLQVINGRSISGGRSTSPPSSCFSSVSPSSTLLNFCSPTVVTLAGPSISRSLTPSSSTISSLTFTQKRTEVRTRKRKPMTRRKWKPMERASPMG